MVEHQLLKAVLRPLHAHHSTCVRAHTHSKQTSVRERRAEMGWERWHTPGTFHLRAETGGHSKSEASLDYRRPCLEKKRREGQGVAARHGGICLSCNLTTQETKELEGGLGYLISEPTGLARRLSRERRLLPRSEIPQDPRGQSETD